MRKTLIGLVLAGLCLGGCASSQQVASVFEYGSGYDRNIIFDEPAMRDIDILDLSPEAISNSGEAFENVSSDFIDLLQ